MSNSCPIHRCHWRLSRLAVAVGLIGLLLLSEPALSAEPAGSAALEEYVRQRKARNEPIELADFAPEPVSDPNNTVWYLRQASKAFDTANDLQAWKDYDAWHEQFTIVSDGCLDPNLSDLMPLLPGVLGKYQTALDLLHKSTRVDGVAWGGTWKRGEGERLLISNLAKYRRLWRLAILDARCHLAKGRSEKSLQLLKDVLATSRVLNRHPLMINYLMGFAARCDTMMGIQLMAPDVSVGEGMGEASARQVRQLMESLLDDRLEAERRRRTLLGERAFILDLFRNALRDPAKMEELLTIPEWQQTPETRELPAPDAATVHADMITSLRMVTLRVQLADKQTYPAYLAAVKAHPDLSATVTEQKASHPLSSRLTICDHFLKTCFLDQAYRRLAAVRLAMRLYQLDKGSPPATLDELVPEYLSAVPADPFAEDATLKLGRWRGKDVIYSIGPNGSDEGGRWFAVAGGGQDPNEEDVVLFLDGRDPTLQRSPEVDALLSESRPRRPES